MSIELLAIIGDLEVANRRLQFALEEAQARISELEAKDKKDNNGETK